MIYESLCHHILQSSKLGYALFDQDLILRDYNFQYSNYFDAQDVKISKTNLWDLMPELVGNEDIINKILTGKKREFKFEKLNKIDKYGKQKYFDLSFSIIRKKNEQTDFLFCLLGDITSQTAIEHEVRQKKYEIRLLRSQLLNQAQFLSETLLGESLKTSTIREFVSKVANHNTNVLLQGESGTGKSLAARLIHRTFNPKAPFIEINCAAIPATLLESELFGYEKGAFTNALMSKKGLLEEAHNGTLFLDEIGEMPFSLQAKLLTFLETKTFRRLGSTNEFTVDARVIAATNKDLKLAIKNKEFRQDLFYRINVVSAILPPLRELGDDIVILSNHFISLLSFDMKKNINGCSESALEKLKHYLWPGNVRELRNVIERAMIFAEGPLIQAEDLSLENDFEVRAVDNIKNLSIPDAGLSLEKIEQSLLIESLRKTRGNQSRSAKLLGLSLDTFRYRIRKFDISPKDYR